MTDPNAAAQPYEPLEVRLSGRILFRGEAEQPCLLETVTGREARFRIASSRPGRRGSPAVAYLDLVGRIEGTVVRVDDEHIVIEIAAPEAKMSRLSRQFALLARLPDHDRDDLRGHRRIVPDVQDVTIHMPDGNVAGGRLRDVSRSGAAVETTATVTVSDRVVLGETRGRVARLFEGGFAVQFARLLPLERFGPAYRL